jgi:Sulfotransferase family
MNRLAHSSIRFPSADALLAEFALPPALSAGARKGLEPLLAALEEEPGLTEQGVQRALYELRDDLRRLQGIALYRQRYPEIARVVIERPLFILGLPRCGTSVLQAFLGADPDTRTPLMWEVAEPLPPPEAATFASDPRIAAFDAFVAREFTGVFADLLKAHPIGATKPQECGSFMTTSFHSTNPVMSYRLPSFYRWFLGADVTFRYEVHKMWLQHLSWHNPRKRLVLKIQEHMYSLPELRSVYPDAIFVQPHRDPVTVIPSISRLIEVLRAFSLAQQDRHELGQEMLHLWHDGQVRMMAYRAANPSLPILDIRYVDLAKNPVGTVRALYEHFDWEFTSVAESALRGWLSANPADKHGKHSYALEDYGLTEEKVKEVYADYTRAYYEYI